MIIDIAIAFNFIFKMVKWHRTQLLVESRWYMFKFLNTIFTDEVFFLKEFVLSC